MLRCRLGRTRHARAWLFLAMVGFAGPLVLPAASSPRSWVRARSVTPPHHASRFLSTESLASPGAAPQTSARPPVRDNAGAAGSKGTAVIRGRVVAADTGAPIRQAVVTIVSTSDREPGATQTGPDGRYEIRDLPSGTYHLSASRGAFVAIAYGQRHPHELGRPLTLADKQVLDRIDFALPRGGVITGRVVDENGEAVSDASVRLQQLRYTNRGRRWTSAARSAQTDDLGLFRLYGLAPGTYVLAVEPQATAVELNNHVETTYGATFYPGTPSAADASRIALGLGQVISGIDVRLLPSRVARVQGTVTSAEGTPVPNVLVAVRPRDDSGPIGLRGALSRADGTFSIPSVPAGEFLLVARDSGERSHVGTVPVSVHGEDLEGISVFLTSGTSVKGRVTVDGGASPDVLAALKVYALPTRENESALAVQPSSVAQDGSFELAGLHGHVHVTLGGLPKEWMMRSVTYGRADVTESDFSVESGSRDELQVVVTTRATEMTGVVTDTRGVPTSEALVVAFSDDAARWQFPAQRVRTVRPDQYGHFTVERLPEGRYHVAAAAYLDPDAVYDPDVLKRLAEEAQAVEILEGQPAKVNLRLRAP